MEPPAVPPNVVLLWTNLPPSATVAEVLGVLRPAYGSGEDWNAVLIGVAPTLLGLRPAYGSGEDWNSMT